jgi:hypothetical protein
MGSECYIERLDPVLLHPAEDPILLKAQYLSRLSIQRRTVVLNIVDIDPDISYIPVQRRLLVVYVACQPLEVSINDGSPRVKKGASISSNLRSARIAEVHRRRP